MVTKTILVTGGAGFIGSAVARKIISSTHHSLVVVDKLTYAGNLGSLALIAKNGRFSFEQADICNSDRMGQILAGYQPDLLMHLAAESHVDRSIDSPSKFIQTNIVGTYALLQEALLYWRQLPDAKHKSFRFLHVSTDEVFGSLGDHGVFTEDTPYDPRSPYSASKAASDHLVRAWCHTYGLPVVLTNCSNNYGPYHYPEKLIPLCILNALEGKALPVYGRGDNVRDWLYVEDHAEALLLAAEHGMVGESYNVGGHNERTNLEVVRAICAILDDVAPDENIGRRERLITFVADRPGHDRRYAIDASKIELQLGWAPKETFESGLRRTVEWYLANQGWWRDIRTSTYQGQRLGLMGHGAQNGTAATLTSG